MNINILKNKLVILAGSLIVFVAIFIYLGFWPVALVNGRFVPAREFNANYNLAHKIYENGLKMSNRDLSIMKAKDIKDEIKRAAIDRIIEDRIISGELKNQMAERDLKLKVEEKINLRELGENDVKKGIEVIYGLTVEEFKNLVLVSEAKKEILEGNLFMKNQKYDQWYKDASGKAKIYIFIPGLLWENGEVVVK